MKNIAEQILEGLSKFYVGFQNRRVLKTMEEIEANTDEQNIPSALLLGEINNKLTFPDGTAFYLDTHDGIRGYNTEAARGADTFRPFSSYDVKASVVGKGAEGKKTSSISITVPAGIKHGLLICVSTGWAGELLQYSPSGGGIDTILSTKRNLSVHGVCSNITSLYECRLNPGNTITLTYGNYLNSDYSDHTGYSTAQLILVV